ncbi:unnamed protein product [Mytilus edulis]|uniref:Uncharacterized protein n=1 Tax=Mytilus edulis TaxID=6550 RepID=A0A8S3SVC0_MYTED|nr:unnamed protein product [Mytilus edulis]
MAIRAVKEEVKKSQKEKEMLDKKYEEIDKEIKSASADFKEALDDAPSSMKLMAFSVFDGTFGVVKKFLLAEISRYAHHAGIEISRKALESCEKLIELQTELMRDSDEVEQVVIDIEDTHQDAKRFLFEAKAHMHKTQAGWKQTILSSDTLVQHELTRSSIKIESSRDALKESRRSKEETFQNIIKTNNRITNTLKELMSFKIEEVNFDDIRKMLVKGLKSIAEVRSEWGKIVRFSKIFLE